MQQLDSASLNRAIYALDNKKFVKFICGASNTDTKQIERLAVVYSLAGVHVIDISADRGSFNAAKAGIDTARKIYINNQAAYNRFNEPLIMISLNSGDDPHFKKADIDFSRCSGCLECIKACPAGAIYENPGRLRFNADSCYGCEKCTETCPNKAISLINHKKEQFIPDNAEAVEIHTGNSSIDEIKNFIKENSFINHAGLVSFSVEFGRFSKIELVQFVQSLISLIDKKVIIQVDGKPMSANNDASSSLQALAGAQVLLSMKSDFYIQIAGGVNQLTGKYLKNFDLRVDGIGYGTFARKIILPYIVGLNDTEFYNNLKKCVNITTNLVENYRKSVENSV